MSEDCCFTCEDQRFRYRAAAIIIEGDCVLFAKNEVDDYYYSVGGGVCLGETTEEAVLREVLEETGIAYEIDRLAFVHENFFQGSGSLQGYQCHEITMFYLMKSRNSMELKSNSYTMGVREHMHWLPIKDLEKYQAYPSFFKEKLNPVSNEIQHIITRQ